MFFYILVPLKAILVKGQNIIKKIKSFGKMYEKKWIVEILFVYLPKESKTDEKVKQNDDGKKSELKYYNRHYDK